MSFRCRRKCHASAYIQHNNMEISVCEFACYTRNDPLCERQPNGRLNHPEITLQSEGPSHKEQTLPTNGYNTFQLGHFQISSHRKLQPSLRKHHHLRTTSKGVKKEWRNFPSSLPNVSETTYLRYKRDACISLGSSICICSKSKHRKCTENTVRFCNDGITTEGVLVSNQLKETEKVVAESEQVLKFVTLRRRYLLEISYR